MQKVILATLCVLGFGVALFALDFPKDYKQGILYASIVRGGLIEELFIAKEAMESLQIEGKLPNGAIITMEEYQNNAGQKGAMNRIIIMQKVGDDWAFESFKPNRVRPESENTQRCYNCHRDSIMGEDIVFTLDKIKTYGQK